MSETMSETTEALVLTKLVSADTAAADAPTGTVVADHPMEKWHARLDEHGRLPHPASVRKKVVMWDYAISFVVFHAVACLAFFPYFFSWTGVFLAVAGCYVFGTLGINLCFHRLLTHQGFVVPKWLERSFATLGVLCVQDTPAKWVAIHRLHHQYSDEQPDPHSPLVNFFWGHMGWLLVDNVQIHNLNHYEKYARDVLKDPYYFALERKLAWVWLNLASWVVFFGLGYLAYYVGLVPGSVPDAGEAAQFGWSVLIWGVFVRTVLVWHITWSVNSLSHVWGYRNYETDENSRNNWFVGLVSNGEGWHNNHHADQRSAMHGHKWWELDVTWLTIKFLEKVGLAKQIVLPSRRLEPTTPAR
ncbi:MAG: fatty acid desaturase [Planctomycetales bacterium]|nr:fatty acid desaturase [Planctomycetales bacterium]